MVKLLLAKKTDIIGTLLHTILIVAHILLAVAVRKHYFIKYMNKVNVAGKNGHETDLEMSPGPLGTTTFEKHYIRIMGNPRLGLELWFKTGL